MTHTIRIKNNDEKGYPSSLFKSITPTQMLDDTCIRLHNALRLVLMQNNDKLCCCCCSGYHFFYILKIKFGNITSAAKTPLSDYRSMVAN